MASALQRMLILGHVEHHNQLEEQARRYEAAGKPHLAKLIRSEAEQLTMDDPFSSAGAICERLSEDANNNSGLPLALPETTPATKKRKKKSSEHNDVVAEQGEELGE